MAISKFSKIFLFFLSVVFVFPLSSFAQNNTTEEIMTFETYYPAPFGVYNEMRAKKMAIGNTYYNGSQYCWSGACSNPINATTNLVVEGKVGIGTVAVGAIEPTVLLKVESNHSLGGNTVEILNRGGGDVGMGFFDAGNNATGNIAYVTSLGPPRFVINQQAPNWGPLLTNTTINEGNGSVGIGTVAATTAPDGGGYGAPKVDIRGQLFLTSNVDNYIGLYLSRSGGPTSGWNSPGGTWGVYRYGSGAADRFCIGLTGVNEPFCILPNGNVGIGTVSPGTKLHVKLGTGIGTVALQGSAPSDGVDLQWYDYDDVVSGPSWSGTYKWDLSYRSGSISTPSDNLQLYNSAVVPVMTWTQAGNVGIGTASPAGHLTVRGTGTDANGFLRLENTAGSYRMIYLMGDSELRFNNGATVAWLDSGSQWHSASDRAHKKDIVEMSKYGLGTVMLMKPREYRMKADGLPQIGFIAQEMRELIPEVVGGEEGQLGIAYGNLAAVLAKAIQELTQQVEQLQIENRNIKAKIALLKTSNK